MRFIAAIAVLSALPPLLAADKLTFQDRVELMRGLMAEYAKAKVLVRGPGRTSSQRRRDLRQEGVANHRQRKRTGGARGRHDPDHESRHREPEDRVAAERRLQGRAALVRRRERGHGPSSNPSQVPVGNGDANAPGGTTVEVVFHKPIEPIKASEVKKDAAAVLDFDQHSATELSPTRCRPRPRRRFRRSAPRWDVARPGTAGPGPAKYKRARPRTDWSSKIGSMGRPRARSPS